MRHRDNQLRVTIRGDRGSVIHCTQRCVRAIGANEGKSLKKILDASPAALAGVTDNDAKLLEEAFGIKTVRQLGENKFFTVAAALAAVEKAG